mgnify:CR=1
MSDNLRYQRETLHLGRLIIADQNHVAKKFAEWNTNYIHVWYRDTGGEK